MEGSRSGFEDTQGDDSAGILLRTRDCEDEQPRLEGLGGEEEDEEEDEETQVGDPVTGDGGEEEDDGDEVLGVWAEELSPADVARLASPAPSSSSAGGAPFFSSFLAAASAL